MHYLLDGYNLIFSLIDSRESLQAQREKIIYYLQKRFAVRKIKGILVFDGVHRVDEESGLSYPSPLIVAYAPKGQSADDYIIERIELSKNPKIITVVTNDRGLSRHAKSKGAKVQETQTFIRWLQKKKKPTSSKVIQDSPQNIERLLKIFEKKLKSDLEGDE